MSEVSAGLIIAPPIDDLTIAGAVAAVTYETAKKEGKKLSNTQPITIEPVADWQRDDIEPDFVPDGPVMPTVPMEELQRRGRRRDPLNMVSVDCAGTSCVCQTIVLSTNADGQLAAGGAIVDPLAVIIRSGFAVKRRARLVAPVSGTALGGVLISPDPNPGWGNSAYLGAGQYDLELADGDLYVSTAGAIGSVQASASGYLVIVSYFFDPGPLEGR